MKALLLVAVIVVIIILVGAELYILSSSITAVAKKFQLPGGNFFYVIGGIFLVFLIILYALKKLRA